MGSPTNGAVVGTPRPPPAVVGQTVAQSCAGDPPPLAGLRVSAPAAGSMDGARGYLLALRLDGQYPVRPPSPARSPAPAKLSGSVSRTCKGTVFALKTGSCGSNAARLSPAIPAAPRFAFTRRPASPTACCGMANGLGQASRSSRRRAWRSASPSIMSPLRSPALTAPASRLRATPPLARASVCPLVGSATCQFPSPAQAQVLTFPGKAGLTVLPPLARWPPAQY